MKRSEDLLAGLDDIDRAALEQAYGSAEDVPGQLRSVCGPAHQGAQYSASPYAVPFLARIAVAGPADARVNRCC
ncbi:hypothetical protein [Streptomyces sp. NPDC006335]|uniref:hypothetical protein n=1 Tax=Streptomyces sp. NPDC006335 TaxID=3156895 RepID=UPI0033B3C24B